MKKVGEWSNPDQARRVLASTSARAYASDWAAFSSWCLLEHVCALPASIPDVVRYFQSLLGATRRSTLRRKLVSIGRHHRESGHPFPTRDARMLEFFRSLIHLPAGQVSIRASAGAETVQALVTALPATIGGIRDRALILVGFTLGCRPAVLVGLDASDLEVQANSITVTVRSGREDDRAVCMAANADGELCAVRWLKSWLAVAHVVVGPVFRPVTRFGSVLANRMTAQSVRLVLKRAALKAGLKPAEVTGDSLRAPRVRGQERPVRSA